MVERVLDVARAITVKAHGQTGGAEAPGPSSAQGRAAATAGTYLTPVYFAWPELLFIIYLSLPG